MGQIRYFNFRLLNADGTTRVRQLVSYKSRVHDSGKRPSSYKLVVKE